MKNYFEFFRSSKEDDSKNESPLIEPRFCCTNYSIDSFLERIKNGVISNHLIKVVVSQNYSIYFDHDMFSRPNSRAIFQELWTNEKFLNAIWELLGENENLLKIVRSRYLYSVNQIFYDYYISKNKKEEIENKMMQISEIVNANYIIRLNVITGKTQSILLCITRFSSLNQKTAAIRLNRLIIHFGLYQDMTVQTIINIFSILFTEGFSCVFNAAMIEMDDKTVESFEEEEKKAYNNLYIAILEILQNMSNIELKTLLRNYGAYISLMGTGKTRFSLHNLPARYGRITQAIRSLRDEEGIYIP